MKFVLSILSFFHNLMRFPVKKIHYFFLPSLGISLSHWRAYRESRHEGGGGVIQKCVNQNQSLLGVSLLDPELSFLLFS